MFRHTVSGIHKAAPSRDLRATRFEPPHEKTNKMAVRPAKIQISLGIRPVWSESSLSAWRKLGSLASHWAQSEDSESTGRMPRLIWSESSLGAVILLVLSWGGSFYLELCRFFCRENSICAGEMHSHIFVCVCVFLLPPPPAPNKLCTILLGCSVHSFLKVIL